jgi:hypothetical protein
MIAYLDLPSGLSGDMFLSCLVDSGWSLEALQAVIGQLALPPDCWQVHAKTVVRGPLRATLVTVMTQPEKRHRHLADVRQIIQAADLPTPVQQRAMGVFTRLAEAEAMVHGSTVEEVHFHEVGALDAIIDIVGVCAGLHALDITQLYASSLPLGEGWAMSAHGRIPVPAPATLALLSAVQAPMRPAPGPGELLTPTGAALLAELATFGQPRIQLQRVGMGAGQKEFVWPNVARLLVGEALESGGFVQLETNIDDMNPEWYNAVSQKLFAAGALDVWLTPIQMKKGRPGVLLSLLAPASHEQKLAELLLAETTTLGVRIQPVQRHEAARSFATVQTPYGALRVKLKWLGGQVVSAKPELDECQRLAEALHAPLRQVYEAAQSAAHQQFVVAPPNTSTEDAKRG